jgi:glycosyltransferase involved in cell wall biosynthesis
MTDTTMNDKPNLWIVTEAARKYPDGIPASASQEERERENQRVNGVVVTYENFAPWLTSQFNVHTLNPFDFPGEEQPLWKAILKPGTPFSSPFQNTHRLVAPTLAQLDEKLKPYMPDHMHIATEFPLGFQAMRWAKRNNIPVSTAFHTNFHQYAVDYTKKIPLPEAWKVGPVKNYLRRFHAKADSSMAASPELRDELTVSGFDPAKIHIVGRGIDPAVFHPYPDSERPLREKFALYVGRLSPGKGVEAFCALNTHGLKKVAVGTGTIESKMKAAFPDVRFVGFKKGEELAKYFSAAELFVMPATTETFGITVIEAGGCGTPVVALNQGFHQPILNARSGLGIMRGNLQQAFDEAVANPGQFLPRQEIAAHTAATWTWPVAAGKFAAMVKAAQSLAKGGPVSP